MYILPRESDAKPLALPPRWPRLWTLSIASLEAIGEVDGLLRR